ncbi:MULTISPECIES: hypothetical protein [Haloferax]|uniref:Uncharacterized protein n=1 Tax=Haloferax lucentense (strain DSM 14919 / JCM 9276 / NCIMB 13854 / Aa 2.2) TaxID=1230452 RepID=M0GU61_HALL2|nr:MULTISPECIES: hypothetical protein [Haloferax]ELZ56508.1 hypothetical protein C460_13875 [Haloferax sp. ATCC BAA-646]ELZ68138.1 hypothetical protein C459_01052 [Haloferax sp. ATCC BAA-645]ELZ68518.1 hypothetical protein C458_09001 [Haloferax sp. ATCC BAA-644]ELZ75057.1 hypothetical protein C456_07347 [Haloferax lucentense DSM 14919]
MRTRTSHSGSIVSEATRYDAILAALPLPLVVGTAVGTLSPLPLSPVAGASGLVSAAVLAYGLFVATPKSAAGPTSGPGASAETDAPLDGVTTRVRDDAGRNRRRGSV